ncbi:hypothetical protein C8R45DRAFT_938102 [Mycena sanguinolenta]|nr:hypothetical protein C8R45DRAFT_938102 [Mycena sanguinolenta]
MTSLSSPTVRGAHGIESASGRQKPKLYVKIYLDGKEVAQTSKIAWAMDPKWDQQFAMQVPPPRFSSSGKPDAAFLPEVFRHAWLREYSCIGSATIQLDDLLRQCKSDADVLIILEGVRLHFAHGSLLLHLDSTKPTQGEGGSGNTANLKAKVGWRAKLSHAFAQAIAYGL